MKLQKITVKGVNVFKEPYTLDLEGRGRLVALVGRCGTGKSTLLEAVPGVLFKRFPSRPGTIYDYAHGRDAFIEATFHDDGEYVKVPGPNPEQWLTRTPRVTVARLAIDAEARTMESYLFVDGVPVTTGRAAEYTAEVERLFGSQALLLSSVFHSQNSSGSFATATRAERKALLIEMLQLGRLEELAEEARRAAIVGETLVGQLASTGGGQTTDALRRMLADTEAVMLATGAREEDAARALVSAKDRLQAAEAELSAALVREERQRGELEAFGKLQAAYEDAQARYRAAFGAREMRGHELKAAKKRTADAMHADRVGFVAREETLLARIAKWDDLAKRLPEIEVAAGLVETYSMLKATADRTLSEARFLVSQRSAELARASDVAKHAEEAHLALKERSALVGRVPCVGVGSLPDTCPLLAEAREAAGLVPEQAGLVGAALDTEAVAGRLHLEAVNALHAIVEPVPPSAEVRAAAPLLASAKSAADNLADAKRDHEALGKTALEKIAADVQEMSRHDRLLVEWEAEPKPEIPIAPRQPDIKAETPSVAYHVGQVEGCKARIAAAEKAGGEASREQARLDERIQELKSKLAAAEADAVKLAEVRQDLADWELLATALGKDGAQALEIDAAGPAIAATCNELLQACFDARFAVSFETLREKKSKPGEYSESFDIRVLDRGETRAFEDLSGGEKAVVGEAISLAIAITNARKSGVRHDVIFRDETAGSLDPQSAQEYVELLRKALDVGGFSQCVFIAHSEAVWQRADSQVML